MSKNTSAVRINIYIFIVIAKEFACIEKRRIAAVIAQRGIAVALGRCSAASSVLVIWCL